MRVQSSEGTKRIEINASSTTCQLYEVIHDTFNLNSFAFVLYKERNKQSEIPSSKSKTIRTLSLHHGDMIYLSSFNDTVLYVSILFFSYYCRYIIEIFL